jgi:hypothetical protein
MVRHLRAHEETRGWHHPVGITFPFPGGRNQDLFATTADWISPGRKGGWMTSPPPADGRTVILLDTDHLWGIGGDRRWVWKSFLRGHHILYMDPLDDDPVREGARRAMGQIRRLAERLDLAGMIPEPRLASTGYCLAKRIPGEEEIVVYQPRSGLLGSFHVDLSTITGELTAAWLRPKTGEITPAGRATAGGKRRFRAPSEEDAVLLLRRVGL